MTSIRLNRPSSNVPWGFRIHGGKDFNQPLIVLKVTGGSIADQYGLSPGDAILQINGRDGFNLRHKEAQDIITHSDTGVDFLIQKGATSTWTPKVTPLGQLNPTQSLYTKTSLKKDHGPNYTPRQGINSNVKPFSTTQAGQTLVNKQFNSPINLYSESSLAETLNAQAEVLAGGAIGVNFKKNQKDFRCENSEVYKMLKEVENEPPEPPPQSHYHEDQGRSIPIGVTPYCSSQKSPVQPSSTLPSQQSLLKSVQAPISKPDGIPGSHNPNLCAECERLIVGVFVRIKDKNLHVECFKCTTCGTSLKNIGYFNINNKLYCDVHAKSVAKMNPPGPNLEPYATFPSEETFCNAGNTSGLLLQVHQPFQDQNFPPHFNTTNSDYETSSSHQPSSSGAKSTRTIPITKPYNYTGNHPTVSIDNYATNVAPLPYHHSPTHPHHVTAPKSPVKAPTQNQIWSSSGSAGSSKIYESKSSSYSSETIMKSSGGKFVWPPPPNTESRDEVMLGSNLTSTGLTQQSTYGTLDSGTSYSSYDGSGTTLAPPLGGITIPVTHYTSSTKPPSHSSFGPSSLFGGLAAPPYKPVAPPKLPTSSKSPTAPGSPYKSPSGTSYVQPPFTVQPNFGTGGQQTGPSTPARGKGQFGRGILPARGKGILTQPGPRIAICASCQRQIRGPFISAGAGKIYCPEHFKCNTPSCRRALIDIGFVEENGGLYCEYCWESYLAPECAKCRRRIKNECLNAIGQHFHPSCFLCAHCGIVFHNNPFYLEDGRAYCEKDWNELFTTKCFACGFPIEAGDRWVEALSNNYHSQCFNCSACKKNLEGASFFAKGGRPFCKQHGR